MVKVILLPEEFEVFRRHLINKASAYLEEAKRRQFNRRLIKHAGKTLALLVQAETGARISEVLRLTKNDLIESNNRILVRFTKLKKKKGQEKQRFVFLSKATTELMKEYLPFALRSERVFPFSVVTMHRWIKLIGEELFHITGKIKWLQIHTHVLRASWIHYALTKGIKIEDVQKMVGHEQITTTQRYIEKIHPKLPVNLFELKR